MLLAGWVVGAVRVLNEKATRHGLRVNWSVIKLMHVADGPDLLQIISDSNPVEFTTFFVCLGSEVSNTGHLLTEIDRRRGLVAVAMRDL